MKAIDVVEDVAAVGKVAAGAATGFSSLFSGLPLVLLVVAAVGTLGGAGTAVWYRMRWLDCKAAGAQALIDQHEIDARDNSKAVGELTNKLNENERNYNYAQSLLANIPRTDACLRDKRVDAARQQLCAKYPKSEACSGPRPAH